MALLRLESGIKWLSLMLAAVFLSGCYRIEFTETLNLDGTSDMAIKMDMSQMVTAMNGMAEGMAQGLAEGMTESLEEGPMMSDLNADASATNQAIPTYTGCDDPLLLDQYGVETLTEEPQILTETVTITKATSCIPGKEEGTIEVWENMSDGPLPAKVVNRKADSCSDPAILAFYQLASFDEPIIETYDLDKETEISCRETDFDLTLNTQVRWLPDGEIIPTTQVFNKSAAEDLEALPPQTPVSPEDGAMLSSDDPTSALPATNAEPAADEMKFCEEVEQNPEEMPFFFTKCEDIAPGVGVFHFAKYDTTGFSINANGTVTYNLEPSTAALQEDLDGELKANTPTGDEEMPFPMDPAAMGLVVDYVLVSPWPIVQHSVGELEDEYTLRVNLLDIGEAQGLSVVLETDGSTLDLISPQVKIQIDNLVASLEEKLLAADAPTERQVEYIYHLSGKIQRLAAIRPDQQVPLGYLQTRLIQLAEDLQFAAFEALESEFLEALDTLSEDAWSEAQAGLEETADPSATQPLPVVADEDLVELPSATDVPTPTSTDQPTEDWAEAEADLAEVEEAPEAAEEENFDSAEDEEPMLEDEPILLE